MTTERPDRGARAVLRTRFTNILDDRWPLSGKLLKAVDEYVAALPDAAELERLREWLATEHAILRGSAHGYGMTDIGRPAIDCPICAALEPEGSAQTPRAMAQHIFDIDHMSMEDN